VKDNQDGTLLAADRRKSLRDFEHRNRSGSIVVGATIHLTFIGVFK